MIYAKIVSPLRVKPLLAKLSYYNFHHLEVVSRYRDTQLQEGENNSYLFNLGSNT